MRTYVLGVSIHPAETRIGHKRLEEIVFDVTRAALQDADVERDELDSVTIAACDELDARSISSMLLAAPAGSYLKDEIKCTDSGLTGLILAAMRIESGLHDIGVVVSWSQTSLGPFEDIMRMRSDPFYVRPIGMNASISDGLLAQSVIERFGVTEDDANRVVIDAYRKAQHNGRAAPRSLPTPADIANSDYVATPLREGHQAPLTDGAVAMVLVSDRWLMRHRKYRPLARLAGMGWQTQAYSLGQERLSGFAGFSTSVNDAVKRAGLETVNDIDVFELDGQTAYHQLAYEHLLDLPPTVAVNPSGGPFAQNPYFCTGLIGAAESVLQLSRRAGDVQVPRARWALAHACHGFAQQGNAAVVFESVN